MGTGAVAEVVDPTEHVAVGDGRCSEHAVIPFDQVVDGQDLLGVFDAHLPAPFHLVFVFRNQTGLHVAAQAFQPAGSQYPFRSTAPADVHVDTGAFDPGIDDGIHIPVADETDPGPYSTDFFNDLPVTGTVQGHYGQVVHVPVQSLGHPFQVDAHRIVDVDAAFGPGTYGNFIHIHVRRMEQTAFGSNGNHGNGTVLAFGHQVGPFHRVYGNVHFRTAGPYFFTDIQHRGFIHFPFANDHRAVDVDGIKHFPHGIHSQLIDAILVAPANATGTGNRCGFRYTDKFHG